MLGDFVFCPVCGTRTPDNDPTQVNDGTGKNQPFPAQPSYNPNYSPNPPAQPGHNPNVAPRVGPGYKSESTGILLAVLPGLIGLNGIGHIYAGGVGIGVLILIASLVVLIITIISGMPHFLFLYLGIWIWQILDARSECRDYNEYFAQHGHPP